MNIALAVDEFCFHAKHIRGLTDATIDCYKQQVRFLASFRSVSELRMLDKEYVYSFFLHGRTNRKWKAATYRRYYMTFLTFFKWCIKRNYISDNPVDDLDVPALGKSLPKKLSKQDAELLLESVFHLPNATKFLRLRNHAIFATFIFAGLRKKELLNLKLTDVDIENFSIFVRSGKGNKDRIVPMGFELAHILKRYLDERQTVGRTCPEFFTSFNKNKGLTQNGLKTCTKRIKELCNITFTIHGLRHTFATLMLEGGCDIFSLSKMLGHSNISTTTIYLSASAEHLRAQIVKHPLSR